MAVGSGGGGMFINITFCKQTNIVVFTGVEILLPFAYGEILRLTEREVTSAISQVCGARVDEFLLKKKRKKILSA